MIWINRLQLCSAQPLVAQPHRLAPTWNHTLTHYPGQFTISTEINAAVSREGLVERQANDLAVLVPVGAGVTRLCPCALMSVNTKPSSRHL
jgi:hypothetical protein